MRLYSLAWFVSRVLVLLSVVLACGVATADELPLPAKHELGAPPLKIEAVDEVVEANDRAVQACSRNLRRADTLAVLMQLTIDGEGAVQAAVPVVADGERAPAEATCLAKVARKLRFPATGTLSQVQYPFMIVSRLVRRPSF